jgi:uncharacterized protein (UPF0548 family)
VSIAGLHIGRLTPARLDRELGRAARAEPTYAHVGSTLPGGSAASTAAARTHQRDLGVGEDVFRGAVAALRTWAPQRGIGACIHPPDAPVAVGVTVLVVLRRGPVTAIAPNRVVRVIDEEHRFGFAYGSLPGHPERGEESFQVERTASGLVRATIRVDAGPGSSIARLGAPLLRALQRRAIRGYLGTLARAAAGDG